MQNEVGGGGWRPRAACCSPRRFVVASLFGGRKAAAPWRCARGLFLAAAFARSRKGELRSPELGMTSERASSPKAPAYCQERRRHRQQRRLRFSRQRIMAMKSRSRVRGRSYNLHASWQVVFVLSFLPDPRRRWQRRPTAGGPVCLEGSPRRSTSLAHSCQSVKFVSAPSPLPSPPRPG
jgi:hypothetical protein